MRTDCTISLYLDKRYDKNTGKFPVKLRVYSRREDRARMYRTGFDVTPVEYNKSMSMDTAKGKYKTIRNKLIGFETRANDIVDEMQVFTFEQFERKMKRNKGDGVSVVYHYNEVIEGFKGHGQQGTAEAYMNSLASFKMFVETKPKGRIEKLTLYDITPKFLNDYEYYMTEVRNLSLTTVGIYARALRAIFNKAIDENEIDKEFYPFGIKRYVIPAPRKKKKALNKTQLRLLKDAQPKIKEQEKARDFWFLSYALSGMNMKDILQLKYKNISDGKIEFIRAKTKRTSKAHLEEITVHINTYAQDMIIKYGNSETKPENYVFGVLSNGLSVLEQHKRIKNFTRFINQHMKKLCKAVDLPVEVSTYWARHSFATNSIKGGATMEFMRESLGHSDLKTTLGYFAGFDDEEKKEFAENLMDF